MIYNFKKLFLISFILTIGGLFLWTSSSRPSILVINSHSTNSPWVHDINNGLRKIFKDRTFYHVYYHYMNNKIYTNKEILKQTTKKTIETINSINPDYLILVDDITQSEIGRKYINHKKIKIIYCSVKHNLNTYAYDTAKNVTGIHISLPLHILNELLIFNIDEGNINEEIYLTHLSDNSPTSREDDRIIKNYKWDKVFLKPSFQVKTFTQWKRIIKNIKHDKNIIIISNYLSLIRSKDEKDFVPEEEVVRWTVKNALVPIIGLYGPFVTQGGYLSIAPSALEQGEKAAKIIENLIEHDVYIDDIPPQESVNFLVYLRNSSKHEIHKLKVPAVYEAFARATHHYYDDK